jgi:uncharacterized membrane protein (UPF0127 family)
MRVTNSRNGNVLAEDCMVASSVVARAVGLLGRSSLPAGEGLLIRPCSGVHAFFMRFPIDVLLLDAGGRVLKAYAPLRPWRATALVRGAKQALELPAGTIARSDTQVNDSLLIETR